MGIINSYDDVRFVISNLTEADIRNIVSDREFVVIKVEPDVIKNNPRSKLGKNVDLKYLTGFCFDYYTLQIDDGNDACGRTYLYIRVQLPIQFHPSEGVSVLYPTVEELIPMVLGKRLIFSTGFAEDCCGVEDVLNRKLQEYVFAMRNEKEYYLYDSFFRVQVFLRKVSKGTASTLKVLTPADVRDFDVNEKILSKLKEESGRFYNDAEVLQYASESAGLQAQYFLSKFHSNRNWNLDPVCILNYRISAFILPGRIPEEKAAEIPEAKLVRDLRSGTKYIIDSIHMDSDICSDLTEFNELVERFTFNISLA